MTEMQRIAVDCGHGFCKGIAEHHPPLMWPSWIAPADIIPETGMTVRSTTPERIAWGQEPEQAYWIGSDAGRMTTSLFSRDKAQDRLTRDLTLLMTGHLTQAVWNDGPVALAVGLPLSWYGSHHRALAEALTGSGQINHHRLIVARVHVFPQSVAAVMHLLTPQSVPGLYGVIDIGYRTTDYVLIDVTADHRLRLAPEPSGTWEVGMHQVNAALARRIATMWQVEFAPHELDGQSTITVRGTSQSLEALRQPLVHQWRDSLMTRVQTAWGPILPRLQACLIIGGAAPLLHGAQIGTMPVTIPAEPQWANVQGYLAAMPR